MNFDHLVAVGLPTSTSVAAVLRQPSALVGETSHEGDKDDHLADTTVPVASPGVARPNRVSSGSANGPVPVVSERCRRLLFLDVDGVLHPLRVRLLAGTQAMDTSHCFAPECMHLLQRVVNTTEAELVLSSSWRAFEHSRARVFDELARCGLQCASWTTIAGGDSNEARVDQILSYVSAHPVDSWAVLDDEDLAPEASAGAESMFRALFRQRFVRTNAATGLDEKSSEEVIRKLLEVGESDSDTV